MLGGLGIEHVMVDFAVDIEREEGIEHGARAGFKKHVAVVGLRGRAAGVVTQLVDGLLQVLQREKREKRRLLDQGVPEAGPDDLDGVDSPLKELLHHELGDALDLGKGHAVVHLEVGEQVAPGAGQELRALAADDGELGGLLDVQHQLEEIAVEGAAETLVGGDKNDATCLHRALRQEGMKLLVHPGGHGGEHVGHELRVGPPRERDLLRLLHLRRGHQLHRLGNLAGVLDRLDAAADVAGGGHYGEESGERREPAQPAYAPFHSSSAFLSSAARVSSMADFWRRVSRSALLRVPRNSFRWLAASTIFFTSIGSK